MIIIISNNLSGLWGLFSGPIIGISVTFLTQYKFHDEFNGFHNNIQGDLMDQSKIFQGSIIEYKDENLNGLKDLMEKSRIIVLGDNFTPFQSDYYIPSSNFIQETSQLSQIIGKIYNENPHNPPLSSVPHSTSKVHL
jgi:hypothetical protein